MAEERKFTTAEIHLVGIAILRKRWAWFVGLGIILFILGSLALGWSTLFTLASMVFIGWLMIVGGVLQASHAFVGREWGGHFVDLLVGILYAVVGFLIVANPAETAVALTLLIALLLIFGGIFRIALGLTVKFHNRMWLLIHGAINLVLGIMIWQAWPVSGLWVIGTFIGIDMLFNGWSLVMLGLAAKNLPNGNQQ